ncbi:MAG TPA: hypothetical protein VMG59_09375 [Phycisphaerae bacterium]|nr:hypothetical protein [Phycisphaerae bacterium]
MPKNLVEQIPHRPPMHWLQSAQLQPDGSVRAQQTISASQLFIVDGCLTPSALIELISQAAACIPPPAGASNGPVEGMLVTLRDARIFSTPKVGQRLDIHVRMIRNLDKMFMCEVAANVGDKPIAAGRFTFVLLESRPS